MQMNVVLESAPFRIPAHLGVIVRTLEKCLADTDQLPPAEQIIWNAFDEAYGARGDYPLWRHYFQGFRRLGASERRALATARFPQAVTPVAVDLPALMYGRHPVEQWGIVAVVAWGGITAFGPNLSSDHLQEFLATLNTLPPLPTCPAHCAFAELVARAKVFPFLERTDEEGQLTAQASMHVRRLSHLLRIADPDFRVGARVKFSKLEAENQYRLIPSDHFTYVLSDVADALSRMGSYVGAYHLHTTEPDLSSAAFEAAYAAWRIRRSQRFAAQSRHHEKKTEIYYSKELQALKSAAFAAAAANKTIEAAGLWWAYLTLFATKRPKLGRIAGWEFGRIREAGLEIDQSRYDVLSSDDRNRDPDNKVAAASEPSVPQNFVVTTQSIDGLFYAHRAAHPSAWAHIEPHLDTARLAQGDQFRLGKTIRTLIAQIHDSHQLDGSTPKTELIDALFSVAMAVEFVRSALDLLLAHPRPRLFNQIVPAARAVARCTQINRIGLRGEKINEWLDVLREKWGASAFESIAVEDRLLLHQVLVGRYATMLRQLSPEAMNLAARQRYYTLAAADYSQVLEKTDDAFEPGPPLATASAIRAQLLKSGRSETLLVSVVALKTGMSILACGQSTGFEGWTDTIPLSQEFSGFIANRDRWFNFPGRNPINQIRWPSSFIALRNIVLALLDRNPGANSITLALEPALASLPWQHLFSYSAGYREKREKPILVTLVPSVAWSQEADLMPDRGQAEPMALSTRICSSRDPDIVVARGKIRLDYAHTVGASVGIVLGHGKWPRNMGEHPEISVDGKLLGVEDWLTLAKQQLLLIHSCWTGHAPMASAWEGALTAHLLNTQCRTIIAPVGRAPIEAMATLDKNLFKLENGATIGERYLVAIDDDPAATLYNLYGDANLTAPQRSWVLRRP